MDARQPEVQSPIVSTEPGQPPSGDRDGKAAPSRWLKRVLIVASGVCAFALVGSIINPEWSQAGDEPAMPRVRAGGRGAGAFDGARSMPIADGGSLIGSLESREYRILIHQADPAPLYTVCTPDGRVLRENLQADDIYREFPSIDLRQLYFSPTGDAAPTSLMMVYPVD